MSNKNNRAANWLKLKGTCIILYKEHKMSHDQMCLSMLKDSLEKNASFRTCMMHNFITDACCGHASPAAAEWDRIVKEHPDCNKLYLSQCSPTADYVALLSNQVVATRLQYG